MKSDLSSSDRWLLSSNLQKAIRRGRTDLALYSAEKLERTHPDYLRRRLRVIGLEDIGIGGADLVVSYLEGSKDCSGDFLMESVTKFAAAPKDRNAAEIMRAAALHSWFEQDRQHLASLPTDALAAAMQGKEHSLYKRAFAGWLLAGTSRVPSSFFKTDKRNFAFFLSSVRAMKLPDAIERLCALGTNAPDYGLGLGCVFSWLHAAAHERTLTAFPLFNDQCKGKLLLSAVDSHTRPGLAAIKRFCGECEPLRTFLLAELGKGIRTHMRYVAMILFRIEGAEAASRLVYAGWQRPFERAVEGELCTRRFGPGPLSELTRLVTENIGILNSIRKDNS